MDLVENSGDQPVLEADQGTDGQKGFNAGRAGDCRNHAVFQLIDKQGKFYTDQDNCCEKQVLNKFAKQLDVGLFQFIDKGFGSAHRITSGNYGADYNRSGGGIL
jgi:hypothetical protein